MGTSDHITKKLKKILLQTSGKLEEINEHEDLIPRYKIIGTGVMYCLLSDNRSFIKVNRGIEAYIVERNYNNLGKDLIYTYHGDIILIESEELIEIGFD
jgi:hypothetical protein